MKSVYTQEQSTTRTSENECQSSPDGIDGVLTHGRKSDRMGWDGWAGFSFCIFSDIFLKGPASPPLKRDPHTRARLLLALATRRRRRS